MFQWTENGKLIVETHRPAYVDVDGTLVIWPGPKAGRVPRRNHPHCGELPAINHELVNKLIKQDERIIVWSRGGAKHAKDAAEFCGIMHLVIACLEKPRTVIDDSPNPFRGTEIIMPGLYAENG